MAKHERTSPAPAALNGSSSATPHPGPPHVEAGVHALDALDDAETEAADAQRQATRARARARHLRRDAEPLTTERTIDDGEDAAGAGDGDGADPAGPPTEVLVHCRRWFRVPRRITVAAAAIIVLICAAGGVDGYLLWHHRGVAQHEEREAEFTSAARQTLVAMMSLDPAKATEDVQWIIDNSAGKFKDQYQSGAGDLIKHLQTTKVKAKVTVSDVAVQSMTNDSATVVAVARTELADPDPARAQPKLWRLSITMIRDGGRLKTSSVEFI